MTRYVTSHVEFTPNLVAEAFWEMNEDEQAEFFNHLLEIADDDDFETQMSAVEKNELLRKRSKSFVNIIYGMKGKNNEL